MNEFELWESENVPYLKSNTTEKVGAGIIQWTNYIPLPFFTVFSLLCVCGRGRKCWGMKKRNVCWSKLLQNKRDTREQKTAHANIFRIYFFVSGMSHWEKIKLKFSTLPEVVRRKEMSGRETFLYFAIWTFMTASVLFFAVLGLSFFSFVLLSFTGYFSLFVFFHSWLWVLLSLPVFLPSVHSLVCLFVCFVVIFWWESRIMQISFVNNRQFEFITKIKKAPGNFVKRSFKIHFTISVKMFPKLISNSFGKEFNFPKRCCLGNCRKIILEREEFLAFRTGNEREFLKTPKSENEWTWIWSWKNTEPLRVLNNSRVGERERERMRERIIFLV